MPGRVEPGWVAHGRIDIVGRDRGQARARPAHGVAVWGMVGQDSTWRVEQSSARQNQARPAMTGQGHEGSVSAGQDWAKPNRAWHDQQNWTGGGGKGSVRQCRARQDRAGPVLVRIGRGRLGQDRAGPSIWCRSIPHIPGALLSLALACACSVSLGPAGKPI